VPAVQAGVACVACAVQQLQTRQEPCRQHVEQCQSVVQVTGRHGQAARHAPVVELHPLGPHLDHHAVHVQQLAYAEGRSDAIQRQEPPEAGVLPDGHLWELQQHSTCSSEQSMAAYIRCLVGHLRCCHDHMHAVLSSTRLP
jgi:hypothetical protein